MSERESMRIEKEKRDFWLHPEQVREIEEAKRRSLESGPLTSSRASLNCTSERSDVRNLGKSGLAGSKWAEE